MKAELEGSRYQKSYNIELVAESGRDMSDLESMDGLRITKAELIAGLKTTRGSGRPDQIERMSVVLTCAEPQKPGMDSIVAMKLTLLFIQFVGSIAIGYGAGSFAIGIGTFAVSYAIGTLTLIANKR